MLDSVLDQLLKLFGGNRLPYHAVLGVIVGVVTVVAGHLIKLFLNSIGRKVITKTSNKVDDRILDIILERLLPLSAILGLYLGMKELRLGLKSTNNGILSFIDYSNIALSIVTAVLLTSVIIKITRTIITETVRRIARRNQEDHLGQTLPLLLNRVATFVIVAIAAIVVLDSFGQNISSILTILGAGSLALGLAAQDTISNMISGFVIMIDRPFRVGDRVKIPTGEMGDVFEIGLRSTKILDFDNNFLVVPNNELIKTRIVNYSYPHADIRVTVEASVAYGSDIDRVKGIMLTAARNHPNVLKDPAPEAYLVKLADSSMNFSLYCRVPSFKLQFPTAEALRISIYNELLNAKIEIPFPQQVIHHKYESTNALQTPRKRKKVSR